MKTVNNRSLEQRLSATTFVATIVLFGLGCMPQPSRVPDAPSTTQVSYVDGKVATAPGTTAEQRKGQVVFEASAKIAAAAEMSARSCEYESENMLYNMTHDGQPRLTNYQVRVEPRYELPRSLSFDVRVTNESSQVLKLDSTVVRLKVADREVAMANPDFGAAVLVPGESKSFALHAVAWPADVDPNDSVATLGFYGVTTEHDQAGQTWRRENFEWAFQLTYEHKTIEAPLAVTIEPLTEAEAQRCRI